MAMARVLAVLGLQGQGATASGLELLGLGAGLARASAGTITALALGEGADRERSCDERAEEHPEDEASGRTTASLAAVHARGILVSLLRRFAHRHHAPNLRSQS